MLRLQHLSKRGSLQLLESQHLSEHEFPDVATATSVRTRQPPDVGSCDLCPNMSFQMLKLQPPSKHGAFQMLELQRRLARPRALTGMMAIIVLLHLEVTD